MANKLAMSIDINGQGEGHVVDSLDQVVETIKNGLGELSAADIVDEGLDIVITIGAEED